MNLRTIAFLVVVALSSTMFARKGSVTVKLSDYMTDRQTHTQSINRCLRDVAAYQKRTIIFDVPKLMIDSVILLDSNTTIELRHCTIQQNDLVFDNVFRGANVPLSSGRYDEVPDHVAPLHDIRILGDGFSSILGPERHRTYNHPMYGEQSMVGDFYGARTHTINFSMVDGFELAGVQFAKTNGWCICFDFCTNIRVHDLDIQSNVKNGDGLDFRCGCKHFRVWNITGCTSDDIVACTALGNTEYKGSEGKYLFASSFTKKMWAKLKADNPDALHIEDGVVKNIVSTGTHEQGWGHGMICLSAYGSQVRNILIKNFREGTGGVVREALVKLYTGYGTGYNAGDLNHITVKNVEANTAGAAVLSNAQCTDITLQDIRHIDPTKKAIDLKYSEGFTIR